MAEYERRLRLDDQPPQGDDNAAYSLGYVRRDDCSEARIRTWT